MEDNEMAIHKLTAEERETYYYIDDIGDKVVAYSTIPKDIRKLQRLGWTVTKTEKYRDGTVMSMSFEAPKNMLSVRRYNPDKPKRQASENAIAALKEYRNNKNKESD